MLREEDGLGGVLAGDNIRFEIRTARVDRVRDSRANSYPKLQISLEYNPSTLGDGNRSVTAVEYVLKLLGGMKQAQKLVSENLEATRTSGKVLRPIRQAETFQCGRQGDQVMVLRPSRKIRLRVQWESLLRSLCSCLT